MSENVVETLQVAKEYRRGKVPVPAVNGVDISIRRGEIVGILGPSGSGKTTLLNMIGGLDRPTGGRVMVDGMDLGQLGEAQLTEYRLRKIGFIFQFYNLIPTLSAQENIELPMSLAKVTKVEREGRAKELLRVVGLEERANHMPDEMSGGEQQRVAVARAFANGPSVILADEPTGDLDSKSASSLMELVKSLRKEKGVTFVVVSHDPLVIGSCDRAYAIRDGKVVRELSAEGLRKAFGLGRSDSSLDAIY
jgi:putative ABC transport system ATP-binding protein